MSLLKMFLKPEAVFSFARISRLTLLRSSYLLRRNIFLHLHRTLSTPSKPKNFTSYELSLQEPPLIMPEFFNFSKDVLDKWAHMEKTGQRGTLPAFWWVDTMGRELRWSYTKLVKKTKQAAGVLTGPCGLTHGDRMLVVLPRVPEWWLLNIAAFHAGVITVQGSIQLTARDLKYRMQTCEAQCVATDASLAPAVDSVLHECPTVCSRLLISDTLQLDGWINFQDEMMTASEEHECENTKSEEPAMMFFTSGTTGKPKIVVHTHGGLRLSSDVCGRMLLDVTTSDVIWTTSSPGWAKTTFSSLLAPLVQGSCTFILNFSRFDPKIILQTLCDYPITTFCCSPTAYCMLLQEDPKRFKFKCLEHSISSGEPISKEVMMKWKKFTGLDVYNMYGQTEMALICGSYKGEKIKPGSMGKASPAYDVQVVDDEGNVLPSGVEGNIGIRVIPKPTNLIFSGYMNDPEATAATMRGDFYLTGDLGVRDEDNYFWFVGRADDVIISSGYRIGPFEVESILMEHPAVMESAVVSSPDSVRGEVVKAFIVLSEAYKSEDKVNLSKQLQEHVKRFTAPYKYPRKVEFVEELPKTITGKIIRAKLRKQEWGVEGGSNENN